MGTRSTKTVVGIWISSIMATSCAVDPGYEDYNLTDDSIYGALSANPNLGSSLFNINGEDIDKELVKKMRVLTELINQIVRDDFKIDQFNIDPNGYLRNNLPSLSCNILSAEDIFLINILADEDLKEPIKNKDFGQFINICREKGYIEFFKGAYKDFSHISLEDIDTLKSIAKHPKISVLSNEGGEDVVVVIAAVVFIVAAVVAAVGFIIPVAIIGDEVPEDPIDPDDPDGGTEDDSAESPNDSLPNANLLRHKIKDPIIGVWNNLNLSISELELYNYVHNQLVSYLSGELQDLSDKEINTITKYLLNYYGIVNE